MRGDLNETLRPTLAWADHDGDPCLRLTGFPPDALGLEPGAGESHLAVLAGEAATAMRADPKIQPAAGRFVCSAGVVDFVPRFPFLAGVTYSLVVAPCASLPDGLVLALSREITSVGATATVTAIHPDVEVVPLNLLKVYVRFSEPMAEGRARRAVRVEDAGTGQTLDGVFLDMDPELWDPERRRLTLLLDPGRIKRGLAPHEEAGYPLTAGAQIRLTIGTAFTSAAGAPLASAFSRAYAVAPALRRPIDPGDWRLDVPEEGSFEPLKIEFDRPLDHAMLEHAFQVVDPADCLVAGAGAPLAGDKGWTFQPAQAFGPGEHRLVVDARLEDLAGNSLRRVFDRDLSRPGDFVTKAERVTLPLAHRP